MAVLWQTTVDDVHYEVRTAGESRRLYTNGVLHSQYHPGNVVTGSVWDLLFLPSLFLSPEKVSRILVLGVGGGSVIHQLLRFVNPDIVVGIELSEEHLFVAKNFFGLDHSKVVLHQADAIEWMKYYQGQPFDIIIDDLYGEDSGQPVRAVDLTADWIGLLRDNLSEHGLLVVNTVSPKELAASSLLRDKIVRSAFVSRYKLTTPLCHNAVGAFFKQECFLQDFESRISDTPLLSLCEKKGRLRYCMLAF